MLSVHAIYDGKKLNFLQKVEVKKPRQVIVTFLDEVENEEELETFAEKFERIFEQWYAETAAISGHWVFENPNHQKIIDMGKPAIPLILKKLQEKPCYIFYALEKITGEDPVPKKHATNYGLIKNDWLKWGKQNGYIK